MKFNKLARIPDNIFKIAKILGDAGYQTFIVGGAIRNILLGKQPKDWDITTDATPDEIVRIFEEQNLKVFQMGMGLGISKVFIGGSDYEISTFRKKLGYEETARPKTSEFSKSIKEDLSHRDLTINSIAFNPLTNELIDPFGGQKDLEMGIIRTTGNSDERFKEDPVRPLRAIRFATQYKFTLDKDTQTAIKRSAAKLKYISAARIKKELDALLLSNEPSGGLQLLHDLGLLKVIIPEVDITNAVKTIDDTPKQLDVRWGVLLQDTGKKGEISTKTAREIMRRLKFKLVDIEKINKLIYTQNDPLDIKDLDITKSELQKMGIPAKDTEKVLEKLLDLVISFPEKNKKPSLQRWVKNNWDEVK